MAAPQSGDEPVRRRRRRPTTAEERERQLTALAYDAMEERIRNRTATAAELIHFAKLGTAQAELEKKKLENENKLLNARVENLASQARIEELYSNALDAMRAYSGNTDQGDVYDD